MFTKLGPKILALRLSRVLGSLLYTDQYGSVPGRDIRHAYICFQALAQLYSDSTSPAGAVLLYFAKVLIVSFGMRWIWLSNILDMGKIFVAVSRSSFRALWYLSCLMGGRWIHLNWVQEFVKGTHYRQRCLCSLLSHFSFFACQNAWTGSPMWILVSFGHQFCRWLYWSSAWSLAHQRFSRICRRILFGYRHVTQ